MEHGRWKKENLSYGYLWWINEDGFAAMGDRIGLIKKEIESAFE